jgi:hypothetical protein
MSRFKVGDSVCYLGWYGDGDDGDGDFKQLIVGGLYIVRGIGNRDIIYFDGIPDIGFFDGNYFALYTLEESTKTSPTLQWVQHSPTKKYIIIEGLIWCYINQQLIDGATKFVATNGYTNEVICAVDTIESATLQAEAYYRGLIEGVFVG